MSWCVLDVTFDLSSARLFSAATFVTYFSYDKSIWTVATDYYFYLILLTSFNK